MSDLTLRPLPRPKASQWSFVIPSYDGTTIKRLSNLSPEDVLYVTFATLDDDTGRRYLQGYIKMSNRFRVGKLKDLIGNAIFTVVRNVEAMLVEIQLQPAYSEFGDPKAARLSGYRTNLITFKDAIKHRVLTPNQLQETRFYKIHPELTMRYITNTLATLSLPPPTAAVC